MSRILTIIICVCLASCDSSGPRTKILPPLPDNDEEVPVDSTELPVVLINTVSLWERDPDLNERWINIDSSGIAHVRFLSYDIVDSVRTSKRDSIIVHFEDQYLQWLPSSLLIAGCGRSFIFQLQLFSGSELIRSRGISICREITDLQQEVLFTLEGIDSLRALRDRISADYFRRGCHLLNGRNC